MVLIENEALRPLAISPAYPPYHNGPYLEEYFFGRWIEGQYQARRKYIDIFWTNNFCNAAFAGRPYANVQEELNRVLNPAGQYFTVAQLDDGPLEELPADTLIFSAGGNRTRGHIVPIPLVCGRIPKGLVPIREKTLLASFVGAHDSHPIRREMCATLAGIEGIALVADSWNVRVGLDRFRQFAEITAASKFGIAPRGYGKSSFRLYEVMQLGAVPVYISDHHYLPWSDELNWRDFCVLVKPDELAVLPDLLLSIGDAEHQRLLQNCRHVYEQYFTLEGIFQNIIKRLDR